MQSKKVFDAGMWLSAILERNTMTKDEICYMMKNTRWIWKCHGKTKSECSRMGYIIFDKWLKEVNNNE